MNSPKVAAVRTILTVDVEDLDEERRGQLKHVIDSALRRMADPDGDDLVVGWTGTTIEMALRRLEDDGSRAQADVIREAFANGGYVTRDRVYKLAHYKKPRTVRGFTRPVSRIVAGMRDAGEVPGEAVDLLTSSYQDGPVADGFYVPAELVSLVR